MRRRVLISCGLLIGALAVLAIIQWLNAAPVEPSYQGRTLTSWLENHVPNSSANPRYGSPGWRQANEALRQIGTNAIPTLLEMIGDKDPPPFLLKLLLLAQRKGWISTRYRYARLRNEEAAYAFEVLTTNAAPAVPGLIRIYERNVSTLSQECAAEALGHIGRPAAAAVPVLMKNFTHTNRSVRFRAVSAVMFMGGDPNVLVPALRNALKDSDVSVRWNALIGLSQFGTQSRAAVPDLLRMLDDQGTVGTNGITEQVEIALWRIAPEKVGKPIVVEEASPIIGNGVTTEALKILFYKKRQALIPAGKAVPCLAQYWRSDPRPGLKLYRGPEGTTEKDHFLGEFEVLDLPTTKEDLNVSVLCVIADNRIFLCARDNTRQLFVGIRRVESQGNDQ